MTIESPNTINTTRVQVGQPVGSIDPTDMQVLVDSAAGISAPAAKTTNYTVALTDRGTLLEMNSTSNFSFLIPLDSVTNFDIGTVIAFCRINTGTVTISAVTPGTNPTGTAINTPSSNTLRVRWSTGSIRKRAANDWVLSGDLT